MNEIKSKLLEKKFYVKFPDDSTWVVPMPDILLHHAQSLSCGNTDPFVVLEKTTIPKFENDLDGLIAYAKSIPWKYIGNGAYQIRPPSTDYESQWADAPVKIV